MTSKEPLRQIAPQACGSLGRGISPPDPSASHKCSKGLSAHILENVESRGVIVDLLPATDAFDFVQIEIVDIPGDYCGWSSVSSGPSERKRHRGCENQLIP